MERPYENNTNPQVYISARWKGIYDALSPHGGKGIIQKFTNIYTLCAALGHVRKRKAELIAPLRVFSLQEVGNEDEWPTLLAIAWDEMAHNPAVFMRSKDVISICNQYAEGGMQYLYDIFFQDHMEGDHLLSPEKKDIEAALSMILKEVIEEDSFL